MGEKPNTTIEFGLNIIHYSLNKSMHSDVVIIGGGLGGLSAGTYLSQHGINVTLIEEQLQVGGYSIAFKRDEFIFDVALHAIPGCAPNQPFYDILTQLKIADNLTFIKLKNAFNVYLSNYNFLIPNNISEFFLKLIDEFPEEQNGLNRLKNYISKHGQLYYDVVDGRSNVFKIITQFVPRIPDFLTNSQISTDVFLNKFIKSQRLKSLLYQAAVFFGEPMSAFPAVNFIIMFYLLFTCGMYTIKGGGQALTNALKSKMLEQQVIAEEYMGLRSLDKTAELRKSFLAHMNEFNSLENLYNYPKESIFVW